MPKLKYNPVDTGPAPSGGVMFARIFGLVVMTLALVGIVYMLLAMSWDDKPDRWEWRHEDIRTNFNKLMTSEEIQELFREKREAYRGQHGVLSPLDEDDQEDDAGENGDDDDIGPIPFGEDSDDEAEPQDGPPTDTATSREREHEMRLAEELDGQEVFELNERAEMFTTFQSYRDASREQCMNEWSAYQGRQAPEYEQLGLSVLEDLPAPGDDGYPSFRDGLDEDGWFYGETQDAIDAYRGRGFPVAGRLFDLYEVKPEEPIVLPDVTTFDSYYEGVISLLGPGLGRNEHGIEQRTVMFQTFTLPDELKEYVNDKGHVSHDDKLAGEHVMVEMSGVYLRRWVYQRDVMPYSSRARQVVTQDWLPLMLTPDLRRADMSHYELTDELLQQVRDALRDDPSFVETEAAYYAMLAKTADADDSIDVVEEIGYFDLAGEETGPRYRGQGIRVIGMIGDNYAPVILPPNIAGLRRVFRALVLDDTADLESPKRYLVDMIEPPTGLEPRAIIDFEARYYRNVFEAESANSSVRPLLVTRRISGYAEGVGDGDWIYAAVGIAGILVLFSVLAVFVMSEKRERTRFEQSTLELSQKRLKARGGLKLKPLPGAKDKKPPDDADTDAPKPGSE